MTHEAWSLTPAALAALGYPRDASHLFGRLQRVETWDERGPVLGREARELAERALDLRLPEIVEERRSADGSMRLVLAMRDGARIEAVHMPRAVKRPRVTVCLSSQVGCAMGCTFCATAQMGRVRQLAAHEIVAQLLAVMHRFGPRNATELSVVFMGMGEPLDNVEALVGALDVLCDPAGLGVAPSRVTVSTVGHVSGLERLAKARFVPQLAVSVNAAVDDIRTRLMPVNRRWPLAALRSALLAWPKGPHQKLTLEYVLIAGENDALDHADRLAAWSLDLRRDGVKNLVNVIPFNAWGASPYREPAEEHLQAFVERLHAHGCLVTVRRSRGRDARGACGTLVSPGTA